MKPSTYENKQLVIDILTSSFDTNKSVNYIVKQDRKRKDRIKDLMNYSFENCHCSGKVYTVACQPQAGTKSSVSINDLRVALLTLKPDPDPVLLTCLQCLSVE